MTRSDGCSYAAYTYHSAETHESSSVSAVAGSLCEGERWVCDRPSEVVHALALILELVALLSLGCTEREGRQRRRSPRLLLCPYVLHTALPGGELFAAGAFAHCNAPWTLVVEEVGVLVRCVTRTWLPAGCRCRLSGGGSLYEPDRSGEAQEVLEG